MPNILDQAEQIADGIVSDLNTRKGLRHIWDEIDDETRAEIRNEWVGIGLRVLGQPTD